MLATELQLRELDFANHRKLRFREQIRTRWYLFTTDNNYLNRREELSNAHRHHTLVNL